MTDRQRRHPESPLTAALVAAFAGSLSLASLQIHAQTSPPATPERRFAVASVKVNQASTEDLVRAISEGRAASITPAGIRTAGGRRFTATRVPLRALIVRAYGLKDYQLEGGPKWLASSFFDIDARSDEDATDEELNVMLRWLLADRFALRTRTETRQLPVHALTLSRSDGRLGSALKRTSTACEAEIEERRRTNAPVPSIGPPPASAEAMRELLRTPRCGATSVSSSIGVGTTMASGGMPITALVERLTIELSGPVIDRTGLTGLFDFVLEFESTRVRNLQLPPGVVLPDRLETQFPPVRDALQKQLGLKLETETGPVPILVIESAELPQPD